MASQRQVYRVLRGVVGGMVLLAALGACGQAPIPSAIHDPYEAQNRRVHAFNKSLDTRLKGGKAPAVATAVPVAADDAAAGSGTGDEPPDAAVPALQPATLSPVMQGASNFGRNLDHPRMIVNSLLQLRPGDAARNTMRFGINSTLGLGGIFDVARAGGMPARETDFGETLHVWRVPEGAYVELPILGPSTQRDAVGKVVDLAINPLWYVLGWPVNAVAMGFTAAPAIAERQRYGETIDSVLYGSADSYAQTRQIYLQNRRYDLGGGEMGSNDESIDLYEELYGD